LYALGIVAIEYPLKNNSARNWPGGKDLISRHLIRAALEVINRELIAQQLIDICSLIGERILDFGLQQVENENSIEYNINRKKSSCQNYIFKTALRVRIRPILNICIKSKPDV